MTIESVSVGQLDVNCYIVFNEAPGPALLIDPGDEAIRILERLRGLELSLEAVLLTHGHLDHWAALPEILKRFDVEVYLHEADFFLLKNIINKDLASNLGWVLPDLNPSPLPLGSCNMAGICFDVLHTPGHSPGSVVFKFANALLTGDTLFAGGIGRTDLPGGDGKLLFQSLAKLKEYPAQTLVYPGHGESSHLAKEQRFNPFW